MGPSLTPPTRPILPPNAAAPRPTAAADTVDDATSSRSFTVTWLLAWLLGWLGADHFYLGKTWTGVAKLVTLGGLGVWALVDLVLVLLGRTRDARGRALLGYDEAKRGAWVVTAMGFVLLPLVVTFAYVNGDSPFSGDPAAVESVEGAGASTDPAPTVVALIVAVP